jgi:hypothetical protein
MLALRGLLWRSVATKPTTKSVLVNAQPSHKRDEISRCLGWPMFADFAGIDVHKPNEISKEFPVFPFA